MKVPQAIFTDEETKTTWYRAGENSGGELLSTALTNFFPSTNFKVYEGYIYVREVGGGEPNRTKMSIIEVCIQFYETARHLIYQDTTEIPESLTGLLSDLIRDEVDAVYDELGRAVSKRDTEEVEAWASKLTDLRKLQEALRERS